MEMLRKPLSVVLGLMALAVLFHFVLSPFYEDSVDSVSVWNVLNWFMAYRSQSHNIGALLALYAS